MLTFIEAPDLHFAPEWFDHSSSCIKAIRAEAERRSVDFIAIPGDLFDRPLFASDRSRYSEFLDLIADLLSVAPIVAIEGTPSHDGAGAYAALERVGVTLLRPGKMYGLDIEHDRVSELATKPIQEPDAVLFGVPELNKSRAQSFGAEEAAADVLETFGRYVREFIAPRRAIFPNVPAVGLLHGVVSDSLRENTADRILSASSMLIHVETIAEAGLDRWSLGDIHTPWESSKLSAGYAGYSGMDSSPWGKLDFVPAFNVVTIGTTGEGFKADVDRTHYGSPERRKISKPLESYDPAVAYWLASDIDDPSLNPAKHGAHALSRITFEAARKVTRRAGAESVDSVTPLRELLEAMDPGTVTPSIAKKADLIDKGGRSSANGSRIDLESLTVVGCSLLGGGAASLDLSEYPAGLIAITGDNGAGKSSLLSFATPYPLTVGKDTSSGRDSAIHEFFTERPSYIEKVFRVGDKTHRHRIDIKGAGTKSPAVECYLYADGENVLATRSWADMMAKCEELYGPAEDYLTTAFSVQPQQSRKDGSIMGATAAELGARVLRITGIDRKAESQAAREALGEQESALAACRSKIEGIKAAAEDPEETARDVAEAETAEAVQAGARAAARLAIDKARKSVAEAEARIRVAEVARQAEADNRDALALAYSKVSAAEADAEAAREKAKKGAAAEAEIEANRKAVSAWTTWESENREAIARNEKRKAGHDQAVARWEADTAGARERNAVAKAAAEREYSEALARWNAAKAEAERRAEKIEAARAGLEAAEASGRALVDAASALADPCEACGHIKSTASEAIRAAERNADGLVVEAKQALAAAEAMPDAPVGASPVLAEVEAEELPERPEAPVFEALAPYTGPQRLSSEALAALEAAAMAKSGAEARLEDATRRLDEAGDEVDRLSASTFHTDPGADEALRQATAGEALELARRAEAEVGHSTALVVLAAAKERHAVALRVTDRVAEAQKDADAHEAERAEWSYLALALRPNKLPAFELDRVLDVIDERATRYVQPFRSGRYTIRTETQGEGKAGTVDRFRVMIHDGETGTERGLTQFSPGEKAFLADAYQKALIETRAERTGARPSPIILDEADAPIRAARIPDFYRIQSEYFQDVPVLVVSHAPDAANFIQTHIDMEDIRAAKPADDGFRLEMEEA